MVPQIPEQLQPTTAEADDGGGRRKLVLGLVAAVVVLGGGLLAFSFLSGSSGGGTGAGSPEAAVEGLVASVDQGDVIGLLSTMDPTETQAVLRVYEALVGVAPEQGGLTFDEAGLLDGIALTMGPADGDELVAEVIPDPNDEDLAVVRLRSLTLTAQRTDAPAQSIALVGADTAYAWSTAEFPSGTTLELELQGGGRRTDLRATVDGDSVEADGLDFALEVVTVRRNGDWYVSPASTAAAIVFDVLALDEPDWSRWQSVADDDGAGGETPEAAVELLFESAGALEIDDMLDMVDPETDRVIHAIWPSIDDAIRGRSLDRIADDASARTERVDVSVEEIDGQTRVMLDGVTVSWDSRGEPVELNQRRWCLEAEDEFGTSRACLEDFGTAVLRDVVGFDAFPAIEDLLPTDPYLVVNERNGRWFVSPLDTLLSWTTELQAGVEAEGELPPSPERSRYQPAVSIIPGETITIDDPDGTVVAVSLPVRSGYTLDAGGDDDSATATEDQVGAPPFLRERLAATDFAVVAVSSDDESEVQFREGFLRSDLVSTTEHRAVVATREQLERTTPVVVRSADGPVEVSVAWLEPVMIESAGATTLTLGDEGVAIVAILADFDEAELTVEGASISQSQRLSTERTVNLTGDDIDVTDASGTNWVAISGAPGANAEVTLSEFTPIEPPPDDPPPDDPPPDNPDVPFNGVIWAVDQPFSSTLDPIEAFDFGHYAILSQSLEYLYVLDEFGQAEPWLAESATASADATTWTFSLRPGVGFHDGSAFDAGDVVYSLQRAHDANGALGDVVSITAIDDLTVEVVLETPDPDFPTLVSNANPTFAILSEGDAPVDTLNGTGPFILLDYRSGEDAFFEVNFGWWAGLPPMDTVEFRFFTSDDAMVNALQAGEVDGIQRIQPFQLDFVGADIVTPSISSNAHRQVWMRTDRGPFADVRVRQALALTLDREVLIQTLRGNNGVVGNDTPIRRSAAGIAQRGPDIAAATQLLADAGFPDGLSVTLNTLDFNEMPDLAFLIADMAAGAGFDITVNVAGSTDFFDNIWCPPSFSSESCDSADFGIIDYGHRPTPDVYFDAPLTSEGVWNVSFFADPTYDALYDDFQNAGTPEEAAAAVAAIEEYLHEQVPVVIPYFLDELFAYSVVVDGVTSTPLGQLNFADAFVVGR